MTVDLDTKKGVYGKYRVERLGGTPGKHDDCWYYVLDFKHDPFSRPALAAYAEACRGEYPELAADLDRRLRSHRGTAGRALKAEQALLVALAALPLDVDASQLMAQARTALTEARREAAETISSASGPEWHGGEFTPDEAFALYAVNHIDEAERLLRALVEWAEGEEGEGCRWCLFSEGHEDGCLVGDARAALVPEREAE